MNLIVDFGNTRVKAAVFIGKELKTSWVFDDEKALMQEIEALQGVAHCLVSSVTGVHDTFMPWLNRRFPAQIFTAQTATPIKNLYSSANTLGSDRLAAAVGSYSLFPDQDVLTIDAGTCLKYNFVNASNEYIGGAISPGLRMRLKAMHAYTHGLPDIALETDYDTLIGKNTRESMLSGALTGAVLEIEGMVARYELECPALQVVLTGGDAGYLCKQVKSRFFTSPNILLSGLNAILNFNIEL